MPVFQGSDVTETDGASNSPNLICSVPNKVLPVVRWYSFSHLIHLSLVSQADRRAGKGPWTTYLGFYLPRLGTQALSLPGQGVGVVGLRIPVSCL
jgi:hypothetical protein